VHPCNWPTYPAPALLQDLHSISTLLGVMWLDAPSLRLDDQAFQDAVRALTGVRTFSSFGNAWTCACSHTVEDYDVAHTLGFNWLSVLVQTHHDDIIEVLRGFVSRLGLPFSREGRYSQLASRTPSLPQSHWDFHCNLRPGPGHVLADVSFIRPLAASYLRPAVHTSCHTAALQVADKCRDYYADHA
jgi:hypothetical protein